MRLVLFFSRNTSLLAWDKVGIFDREVAIYRRLQERGVQISFVTYGDSSELQYHDRIPGFRLICNRWKVPESLYLFSLLWFYPSLRGGSVVLKSNQVKGAEVGLFAAKRFSRPFIARCGYLHSDFTEQQCGEDSSEAKKARALEETVFKGADRVVVTSAVMATQVASRYGVASERIRVIPNYVDTETFCQSSTGTRKVRRICFVGRLEDQKNPHALVDAVEGLDAEVLLVGEGSLRKELEEKAKRGRVQVRFLGNVPNTELPEILNACSLFVLPSLYEGHPKALLEAMSCGLPVLGTNVPGIREVIDDGTTGILCGTSSEELRRGIVQILGDAQLRERLGKNARAFVLRECSLDKVAELEFNLIEEVHREHSIRNGKAN